MRKRSRKEAAMPEGTEGTEGTEVAAVTPAYPAGWIERVGAFAGNVGRSIDDVSKALAVVVGEPGDQALAILADDDSSPLGDIAEALQSLAIPKGVLRKNLALLRGPKAAPVPAAEARVAGPSYDVLPSVPDTSSFLELLKVGGVLKVGPVEVMSALKASYADRMDLFDVPDIIMKKMEEFADTQGEPCGENFFRLHKLVTSRSYAEVLSVINVPGTFVSERRKKAFLARLESIWAVLNGFHKQLVSWQEAWSQGMANPGMMLAVLAMGQSGAGMLPPGMMQPPETNALRDAAEAVVDAINKAFAGPGIPVARALAYDAEQIRALLDEPTLPASVGVTTKEQLVKLLGKAVTAEDVRLERSVTRYALSIMELPKITAGQTEYAYLAAMLQLGASIPWDKLMGTQALGRSR